MKACNHRIHKWRSFAGWVTSILLILQLQGCAEVSITHRKGLHLVPETELLGMSLQQYDEVLKESKLSTDTQKVEMVRRTGNRIAKAAEAFLSETGLAVVLGHEVAHALADHGNERMSEALIANMGGMALSVALSRQPQQTQQLFMTVYGAGASVGFLLPYSRLHESEADRIGLTLMARAGYDPRQAIPFWERMSKQEGNSRPPEFLSTHPATETRIADIKKYLPEALPYYDKTKK